MGTVKNCRDLMSSVSIVFVVEDLIPPREVIINTGNVLAEYFVDSEFIVVANGINDELALALKKIVAETPDATCIFLGERADFDAARVLGIDHAIGDYVFLLTPTDAEISVLPSMIDAAREGFDLVIAKRKGAPVQDRWLYYVSRRLFLRFLGFIAGVAVDLDSSPLRLLSRPAALHLLNQRHAELLLKSSGIGSGFPSKVLEDTIEEPVNRAQRSMSRSVGKGLRAIVSSGSVPVRLASVTALATGGLALVYSLYVVATYLFKPDVAPGWTTVSLQVSGMMFLFAIILALLAEYIIQIYEGMPVSRRRFVTREFKSERTRRSGRLNVVDYDGRFQLGAPQDLAPEVHEVVQHKDRHLRKD